MILVTGAAGFIGFHVAERLLRDGHAVHGIDNLNDYYDPGLKQARLRILQAHSAFTFHRINLVEAVQVRDYFSAHRPSLVVHLAAQAGVRRSLTHPREYLDNNILGFLNMLEGCRDTKVDHLVYASSSSVYGLNQEMPLSVHQNTDHQISVYGATKKANELMAHTYSHLYSLPTTGLRFFTVYGPWGRPDMAYFLFTKAILDGSPINVYNHGEMERDFTYVDDIVEGVTRILFRTAAPNPLWLSKGPDPASSLSPYRLYNIGNHSPVNLLSFIGIIEDCLGKKAVKNFMPGQPGDVLTTTADVTELSRDVGFEPRTAVKDGVKHFVEWFQDYYRS